uniref:claudin-19-like n=1 Tax=Ciona intestinalis TaxID=7719 RepID=UPI0005212E38|nr:claudin-19-like [Ciona intestinalis]|eukprot:XP_009860118.1 claudin-19-like [Ciona intestinalis]
MGTHKMAANRHQFCFTIFLMLGVASTVMIFFILITPEWKTNSAVTSNSLKNFDMQRNRMGLWKVCMEYLWKVVGARKVCDQYDPALVGVPGYLRTIQVMMMMAISFSLGGVVCSLLGLKRVPLLSNKRKNKTILLAGVCHVFAGMITCVCVSRYAVEVTREYYAVPAYQLQVDARTLKYTFGTCLYVGWAASALAVITGCLMMLFYKRCRKQEECIETDSESAKDRTESKHIDPDYKRVRKTSLEKTPTPNSDFTKNDETHQSHPCSRCYHTKPTRSFSGTSGYYSMLSLFSNATQHSKISGNMVEICPLETNTKPLYQYVRISSKV